MKHESTSKRRGSRFQAGLPALIHGPHGDLACEAHDLSRGGVLLVGRLHLSPAAARVRITIRNPAGDLRLSLTGRVNRLDEEHGSGETQVGVSFGNLDEEQARTLEALVARVVAGFVPARIEELAEDASPAQVRDALEKVPPAHRVALASRANIKHRALLRHDTNLQVLESLARNPHTSPPEMKALLRLRRLSPRTLELVAADPRWQRDEEILIAIVTHPCVTLTVAQRVAAKLSPQGVKRALLRPSLPAPVKSQLLTRAPKKPGW